MSYTPQIQAALRKVNDALRDVFFDGETLTLIKASATANEFTDVLEVSSGWFFENEGDAVKLTIPETSDELTDAFAEATHFKVNDTVFEITQSPDTPPIGADMEWVISAKRQPKRSTRVELW